MNGLLLHGSEETNEVYREPGCVELKLHHWSNCSLIKIPETAAELHLID